MDSSGAHLWLILWKAYQTLRDHAEGHIASIGLGLSDFGVLEALLHRGPLPINQIGEKVNLTSGSITVAVDRLEHKGLVEGRNDAGDRRARIVHLTEAGARLIQCAFADHLTAMERATSALSEEERGQAINLLRKLGLGAQAICVLSTPKLRDEPVRPSDPEPQ